MQDMQQYRQAENVDVRARSDGKKEDEERTFRSTDGKADSADSGHSLIPAKRVNGSDVFNQAGEKIGKIEDIAIDKRTGKVAYAVLSFGGFLGLGGEHQPLPWSALEYDEDREGYVVEVTEQFLKLAPKLDTSELSGWDDSEQRTSFHEYYAPLGAQPYW